METTPNNSKDLVMGISRSGRVRKKSSKLMDFQSPDEIEPRTTKKAPTMKHLPPKTPNQQFVSPILASPTYEIHGPQVNLMAFGSSPQDKPSDDDESLSEEGEESLDSDELLMEVTLNEHEEEGEVTADPSYVDPTVRQSLYMSEKFAKKKILKDGKVVNAKAQRKDKGKTRFTAYMMWSKDVRKQMIAQQPDLDFATISRRLGEMWGNVPTGEKYNWKRRAKRQANRAKNMEMQKDPKGPTKFLNKISMSHPRKFQQGEIAGHVEIMDQNLISGQMSSIKQSPPQNPVFKVTGIDPIDAAAHLKLLGDSLGNIGQRLKQHDGQITVSGSLSVLLDSLLCALGPLMCLTMQIPGISGENNPQLKECLQKTLDNIAYVMPGI